MINFSEISKYSPLLLRIGIAFVFFWFGISQLLSPLQWTGLLPAFTYSLPVAQTTIIYINGTFEVLFATLLLLGFYTRAVSFLLGLHLLMISYNLGYGPTAIRDLALAIVTFAIFLRGPDEFCLDKHMARKE